MKTGAHEFGHLLDYQDVYTNGCNISLTVMWHEGGNYPGSLSCADQGLLITRFTGNTYVNDEWVHSMDEEDCYDQYKVTIAYWWDSQGYHEIIIGRVFWDHVCGPPPI
ncbi:MAG TPA: hypothetical protein VJN96_01670 [Vicinamibacterales bacterium]|nr:hypothetical protein [Vicinamibacterales bacterium]